MNHLAHVVLSGDDPRMQVGGLLGDFWHGALPAEWPASLARGVRLHRRLDTWTDAHPVTAAARALFPPPFRRYAGILLDVWFDHLLALDFQRLTGAALEATAVRAYAALREETSPLPPAFRLFAARLESRRGLQRNTDPEYIEQVLERISERLARSNPVAAALPLLRILSTELGQAFGLFWPELARFAAAERGRLLDNSVASKPQA